MNNIEKQARNVLDCVVKSKQALSALHQIMILSYTYRSMSTCVFVIFKSNLILEKLSGLVDCLNGRTADRLVS